LIEATVTFKVFRSPSVTLTFEPFTSWTDTQAHARMPEQPEYSMLRAQRWRVLKN